MATAGEKWRTEKVRQPRETTQKFVDLISAHMPAGVEFHIGGSWRRGKDMIGDIDVMVVTPTGEFTNELDGIPGEWTRGRQAAMFGELTIDGVTMHIDFWATTPASRGAFLAYVTGPMELNVAMRSAAIKQGLSLKQYGLVKRQYCSECHQMLPHRKGYKSNETCVHNEAAFTEIQVDDGTEEDVFEKLGWPWIAPTDREHWQQTLAEAKGGKAHTVYGSKGDQYTVTEHPDGKVTCTCPGFKFRGACKHTKAVS